MPIGVSPTGTHKLFHDDGEAATANACKQTNTLFCLSSWSSMTPQEVNAASVG